MVQNAVISIKNNSENVVLQKEQKRFNKLTTDIAKKRQKLADLNEAISKFKIGYAKDIVPWEDKKSNLLKDLLFFVDKNFEDNVFTKTDRKRMSAMIEELMSGFDEKYINDELKSIFAIRVGEDFDLYQKNIKNCANDAAKDLFKSMFDVDVDLDDDMSPEEAAEHLARQFAKHQGEHQQPPPRKKSARELAKEAREKAAAESTTKSMRDVYRQLAKALHPDRIAQDEDYQSKNSLMQEVNAAYARHDLLTLLEIQLKIEQISQDNINNIALDKLKHFNAVLKKQFDELDGELMEVSQHFAHEFPDVQGGGILEARSVINQLKSSIRHAIDVFKDLQQHVVYWKMDLKYFRGYLREAIDLNKPQEQTIDPIDMMVLMSAFEEMKRR